MHYPLPQRSLFCKQGILPVCYVHAISAIVTAIVYGMVSCQCCPDKQPFAFIDPFGYSDTPMSIISRLMRYYGCEVLITFMYEEINRFLTAYYRTKEYQYDALFMKDAMWAADPSGIYQFSDFTDQKQLLLFQPEPDYSFDRGRIALA